MVLVVNIGNSDISVGLFSIESADLLFKFSVSTDVNKTSDEYCVLFHSIIREKMRTDALVTASIVSSVVPQLTEIIFQALHAMIGVRPILVGPGIKTGFPIKIDSPSELGGDMVANTAALLNHFCSFKKEKLPAIVADFGAVTTISAVNRNGEYIGCSIFPGIRMSFASIHNQTAQLPNVVFSAPEKAIGKNSRDSIRAGVIYGSAMMLDGFVERFAQEMRVRTEDVTLVVTGEFASALKDVIRHPYVYDEYLTLRGLYYLYRNAMKDLFCCE